MRSVQRGISTVLIMLIILIIGIALASGAFIFNQNQKAASISSFDECAKLYPVMESYPAQCNTPDGRHFVQELSEEEKQKLIPPSMLPQQKACTLEAKICPDGSSVGRTGPNCEFAACPE